VISDNQGGPDAAVKKIYRIGIDVLELEGQVIEKELVKDLINIYSMNGALPSSREWLTLIRDKSGLPTTRTMELMTRAVERLSS